MSEFNLRFDKRLIPELAEQYPVADDALVENEIAPLVRGRRFFTKSELIDACYWKTNSTKGITNA